MAAAAEQSAPLLAGRYRLGPELGRGGFSQVHQAYDTITGRTVALKRLRDDLAEPDGAKHRLILEGRLLKTLRHPNIVTIHEVDEHEPYLALEFLPGKQLVTKDPLSPATAIAVVCELLAALSAAHAAGIVHRDVKPSNLMLSGNRCVLIDFGIAQAIGQASAGLQTETCAVVGSAGYFSPEQVRGEAVDPRSDLFSAGLILFELLAGEPAFMIDADETRSRSAISNDNRAAALAYAVIHLTPRLENRRSDLPASLTEAVAKAIAKLPADRFQSAAEMAEALMLAAVPLPRSA